MNPGQNKMLHALLTKTGLKEHKAMLVSQYTNGRTESSAEMDHYEAQALISSLKNIAAGSDPVKDYKMNIPSGDFIKKLRDKRRKTLIAMSYSMGENVQFVKDWCEKYGVNDVKRKFNEYDEKELMSLIQKFKKVTTHRIDKTKI